MPTILTKDLASEWLLADLDEERISEIASYQFPAEQMQACNIPKNFRSALEPTGLLFMKIYRLSNSCEVKRSKIFLKKLSRK